MWKITGNAVFYIVLVVIGLACCSAVASASDPPVADFTLSAQNGPAPHTVTITDASSGSPSQWEWYIDDQLYDVKQGPFKLTFNNPGNYKIGLFVQNQYGSAFTEKTITVLPACSISAIPDKTTFGWGDDVTVSGTVANCADPVALFVTGPGLPAEGIRLEECKDVMNMPLSAGLCPVGPFSLDGTGPFTLMWETSSFGLNNGVQPGKYSISFVEQDGKGPVHSSLSLDFTSLLPCFLTTTADKTSYQWGEQVKLRGSAINCPNGIKVKLGEAPGGPELPVTVAPRNSGIPEGFDLATGQAGSDGAFSFTFDSKALQQAHSLKDGRYAFYVLDMDEKLFSRVEIGLGSGGSATVPCTHVVTLYDGKVGDSSKPVAGIGIEIIGSEFSNSWSPVDLVNSTMTSANGRAVLIVPDASVGKWKYFFIRIADPMPPGYGWQGAKPSIVYDVSETCGTGTELWIAPVPGLETSTPVPFSLTATPGKDARQGEGASSIIDIILAIPRSIISFIIPSTEPRPENGIPVNDPRSQDYIAVQGIQPPPDIDRQVVAGNDSPGDMQVVVLPQDDVRTDTREVKSDEPKADVVIIKSLNRTDQEHMDTGSDDRTAAASVTTGAGSLAEIAPIRFPSCPSGYGLCNNVCVDLDYDSAHCGACGKQCPAYENCMSGVCVGVTPCPTLQNGYNMSWCDGTCVDLRTDAGNCGSCGNACMAGATCENGQCVARIVTTQQTLQGNPGIRKF